MNLKCHAIQKAVLASNGELPSAIERHCRTCLSCDLLRSDWELFRDVTAPSEVPLALDINIMLAASEKIKLRSGIQNIS